MKIKFPKLNKRTWIAVTAVVVLALGFSFFFFRSQSPEAEASWWDEQWYYRKSIEVGNSTTTLTDFQVKIVNGLDVSTDITNGKIKSDLGDIRFTDNAGNILNYWLEDTTSTSVDAWVKVPTLVNGTSTIYMYYGNPSAQNDATNVGTSDFPALSCKSILSAGDSLGDGSYWIDPTNGDSSDKEEVYCDMTNNAGGWILVKPSMVDSVYTAFSTTSSSTDSNGGISYNFISTGLGCETSSSTRATIKIKNTYQWDRVRSEKILGPNGTASCWGTDGASYTTLSNLQNFDSGYDTLQSCILTCEQSPFTLPPLSACDNAVTNFARYNGTSNRSFEQISRRTNRTTISGPAVGLDCNPIGLDWTVQDVYIREDSLIYSYISMGSPASEEKGPGPVAYWSFDEGYGQTAYDLSANKNDMLLGGGTDITSSDPTWINEGKMGKALRYDDTNPSDLSAASSTNSLNITNDITIEAWVKLIKYDNYWMAVVSKDDNDNHSYYLGINDSGFPVMILSNDGQNQNRAYGANVLQEDKWYHLAGVYNGTDMRVYVNGQLDSNGSNNPKSYSLGIFENTSSDVIVGNSRYWSDNGWKGDIDEVKIYNYARTADQIKIDYNKGFSTALGNSNPYASLSDGLVGWWQVDELATTTGAVDASGNGNTGTYVATASTTSGKYNRSLALDGNSDYIQVAHTEELNMKKDLSIALWIYPTVIDTDWIRFVEKSDYGNSYSFTTGSGSGRDLSFWLNDVEVLDTDEVLTLNTWQHVALTYNGVYAKIFLNGELVKSTLYSGSAVGNSLPLTFGEGVGSRYFEGMMDEIRIYNRGLSDDEVRRLYEWAPGPVGYWKLDDASGTIAVDSSGNGNNGTLNNGPVWISKGKIGGAIQFDGSNDYVRVSSLNPYTYDNYSISTWYKSNVTSLADDQTIWVHRNGTIQVAFTICDDGGYVGRAPLQNENGGNQLFYGTSNVADKKWHYLTAVRENGILKIYVDGKLENTKVDDYTNQSITINGNGPDIGDEPGNTEQLDGMLDDLKFYNYARSQRQILEDMNAGKKNNPIGYWSFDEGQGQTAKDYSGYGNDGTLINMATSGTSTAWTVYGKSNSALKFDSTDGAGEYVVIPYSSSLNIFSQTQYTVSLFVRPVSGSPGTYTVLQGTNHIPRIVINPTSAAIEGYVGAQFKSLVSTGGIMANEWNNVVFWSDGIHIKIFINGIEKVSQDFQQMDYPFGELRIGATGWSSENYWGDIDEVKMYNYPLTLDEIRQNLNLGQQIQLSKSAASNRTDGLLMWWKMDESSWNGTAGEVKDYSGNGNHGYALGDANSTSTAKFGRAGNLDGDTDRVGISTAGTSLVNIEQSDLTMSIWLKTNTIVKSFADITYSNGSTYFMHLVNDGSIVRAYFYLNGTEHKVLESDSGSISVGLWYHMAVTRDYKSGDTILYLNGVEVDRLQAIGTTGYSQTAMGLGNGSSYCFDGQLDDFKIYNTVRTPAQIMSEFADGPSPMAWWKLDDLSSTSALDSSGNGNTGTLTNGPAWKARGKVGGALSFDGIDDYVSVGHINSLTGVSGLSISAWIKPDTWPTNNPPIVSMYENADGQRHFYFKRDGSNNYLQFIVYGDNGSNAINCSNMGLPTIGQWSHVLVTYNNINGARCYLNGLLTDTDSSPGIGSISVGSSTQELKIGRYRTFYDDFDGLMDDIKVYNYGLTSRQVAMEYNNGAPIGYWKMDEGEGVSVKDYSGLANHGTLIVGSGGSQSATSSAWTNGASGKINSSLNFDGTDDWVNLSASSNYNFGTNGFSFGAWFNSNSYATQERYIIDRTSATTPLINLFTNTNGTVSCRYRDASSNLPTVTSVKTIQTGSWYQATCVKDVGSDKIRLYVNGEEWGNTTDTTTANIDLSSVALRIGGHVNGGDYTWNGKIDEFKIWNYTLTPEEVKKEFNGGFSSFFK